MTAPRGSARWFNEMFEAALKRAAELIDAAIEIIGRDGYPALTEPVTLGSLKKLPAQNAVAVLQAEVARQVQRDPVTGRASLPPEMMKLVREYMTWARGADAAV